MSRAPNGNTSYTNGSYNENLHRPYNEGYQDGGPLGGGFQLRPGGYGGLQDDSQSTPADGSDPSLSTGPAQNSQNSRSTDAYLRTRFERGNQNLNATGDRESEGPRLNGRSIYGDGPGGRALETVLEHIQDKWDLMTKDDCIPVHIALQLMDYSSLGRGNDYQDFQRTNKQLHKGLKAIVNEHHQGFNSSIGTFHKIQASIQTSQHRVRSLKDSMIHAKLNLMVANPELKGLGVASQRYDEMLQVMSHIWSERLQLVPEQLDARIAEKQFLSAVDILQDALRMIRKSEMENIGALSELRIYFDNQETSLTDILIEELHDHLYLKSPYCQDRWRPYTPGANKGIGNPNSLTLLPNTWGRPLYQFLEGLDTSAPVANDVLLNPEADSFTYIHIIIESLNKLGRLDVAVDRIEHRLPIELHALVDRTNLEVDLRHPVNMRGPRQTEKTEKGMLDYNLLGDNGKSGVLNDLLWTLYSKFEAIAEGHRVLHDVIAGIVKREGLEHSASLTRGFKELWKLYQSEMRSLLHDSLVTDGNPTYRAGQVPANNANIFSKDPRDRSKQIFKLAEIDGKSADLASEQEDLDQILQESVPGLISKPQRRSGVAHTIKSITSDGAGAGHKLLTEPSVFNISLLLPPSLSFLQRLRDIVPVGSDIAMSTLTSFLDDFLVNVFQPQLEETVTELCTQSFIELDAFQEDAQWSQYAPKPIFKGTSTFFTLVRAFCKMLDTIPQNQSFTQLIMTQMVAYYDKCCGWYKLLVARALVHSQDDLRKKIAAAMAESGELREVVQTLRENDEELEKQDLLYKEVELLITQTNELQLDSFDIIADKRSVAGLCLLYTSMQWLADQFAKLRYVIPTTSQSSQRDSLKANSAHRWTLLETNQLSIKDQPVYLPMTSETVVAFDKILSSMRTIASTALLTLHLDIRIGIIYMLNLTLRTPYLLSQSASDADPNVLSLNSNLISNDDTISTYLPSRERNFIISGLGALIDILLVRNANHITAMNLNGCERMQLNILVLQQNLKNIEDDITLGRSALYFDLIAEGGEEAVKKIKAGESREWGFGSEELKTLLGLCWSEQLGSAQRDLAAMARKGLDEGIRVVEEGMPDGT